MDNKHLVSIVVIVVFVAGMLFISTIPREGFPNVDTNKVTISSIYPGGAPRMWS